MFPLRSVVKPPVFFRAFLCPFVASRPFPKSVFHPWPTRFFTRTARHARPILENSRP